MKKKIIFAISLICALSVIILGIFLLAPTNPKEVKLFVNPKSNSAVFDNYVNGGFKFNYGNMKIYDISLEDFKIMVKFEDGSVKTVSSEDKELLFSYSLETSSNPAPVGEYEITIGYKTLTKTYKVIVSNILVEKPTLTNGEFIFDGTIKCPEISNYNLNENNLGIICTGEKFGTNAKDYLLTFSLEDGYSWSDGTTDDVNISWMIKRKRITQNEIDSLDIKISGENVLETAFDGNTKTIISSKSLPEYLEIIGEISAINVGNYIAEIKIKEKFSNNYEFEKNVNTNISWRISKIKINIPILKDAEIDFFEGMNIDKTSLFKTETNDKIDWRDSLIVLSTGFTNNITKAGTYSFSFRIIDKAHYMWEDGSTEDLNLIFKVNKIEKFILDLNKPNHFDWSRCGLLDNKFIITYNGMPVSVISPIINYTEIVGDNIFIGNEISITSKYYKDDIEIIPVDAGDYEVRFYFEAKNTSNFEVLGEYVSKELIINKFEIKAFEVSNLVMCLGEKLKDNNFEISFKDVNNNIITNGNYKFKNPLDMNRIVIEEDEVLIELENKNYMGNVLINYEVVDIIDRVVVNDKHDENIYNVITGKEFYELKAYNLDKYYEFYFKTNYDLKLYDDAGNEESANIVDFSNDIFNYVFKDREESIILCIPNLSFADETMIEKVVVTKLLFDKTEVYENLEIGLNTDYKFESSSGIIINVDISFKAEYEDYDYSFKAVDKDENVVNFSNQNYDDTIYLEIYNGENLIEKRSIFICYNFEYEKIINKTLEVDSEIFYNKVISSAGNEFYIENNIVYQFSNGRLIQIEYCLDLEENKFLNVISSKNYISILDDETGEFNVVDGVMLSKNTIGLYGDYYYEVYNDAYEKTGEIAILNSGILTIYEILDLEQKENEKYYFVSDRVLLGEEYNNIYIEDKLGYMVKFIEDQESLKIKVEIEDTKQNKYYIRDIITVKRV